MPDLLLAGRIWTLDPSLPAADAALVRDGRFVAVGSRDACEAAARPGADRRAWPRGCATPGLVDAHGHVYLLGRMLIDVDCRDARSEAECVARVAARASASTARWVRGRGWDQNRWPGTPWPSARSLDAAVGDRPVFLDRVDGHAAWVSSAGLALAGIGRDTPDPPGGKVLRDANGHPSGVVVDAAREQVLHAIGWPPADEIAQVMQAGLAQLQRFGITGVHDAGVTPELLAGLRRLAAAGDLPLRVYAMVDGLTSVDELQRRIDGRGPAEQGLLTMRAVKLFADGALGSRGAALLEPYADEPATTGLLLLDGEELRDRLRRIARAGLQPAVHAIGDRACREVLRAFSELSTLLRPLRPRVEHLQIVDAADWALLAASGAVASMQPVHQTSDAPWFADRVGEARAAGAYAWRTALERAAALAFGSDFPVESADPRLGLAAAETRVPAGGDRPWHPEQRLTRLEALRAFTAGAAYAEHAESRRGVVRPGFDADLTVWGEDVTAVAAERLHSVPIVGTVVGGRCSFDG